MRVRERRVDTLYAVGDRLRVKLVADYKSWNKPHHREWLKKNHGKIMTGQIVIEDDDPYFRPDKEFFPDGVPFIVLTDDEVEILEKL